MIVVPVIDLMHGQCVHAVGGQRQSYRPLTSQLVRGSDPTVVATVIVEKLNPRTIYVADLDAIVANRIQWDHLDAIANLPCDIWLDVGVCHSNLTTVLDWIEPRSNVVCILATETVDDGRLAHEAVTRLGRERVFVSIDMRAGQLMTACAEYSHHDGLSLYRLLRTAGIQRYLLLDIGAVGVSRGCCTLPLVTEIKDVDPGLFVATGGGIRNTNDLMNAEAAGCDAVLVGTSIHDKSIAGAMWPLP